MFEISGAINQRDSKQVNQTTRENYLRMFRRDTDTDTGALRIVA